jgi:hypothetical protein
MSDIENESTRATRRYGKGYSDRHPVPTIQGYRHHQDEIKEQEQQADNVISGDEGQDSEDPSKPKKAFSAVKAIAKGEDQQGGNQQEPYPTSSRNDANRPLREDRTDQSQHDPRQDASTKGADTGKHDDGQQQGGKSATETAAGHLDPKQKRKDMKKIKRHGGGREVTDPVTHMQTLIRDMTDKDLAAAPNNESEPGSHHRNMTGGANKSADQLDSEHTELRKGLSGMQKLFPPPDFHDTKKEMMRIYRLALRAGLGSISIIAVFGLVVISALQSPAPTPKSTDNKAVGSKWFGREHDLTASPNSWLWSWLWITLTLAGTLAMALGVTIGLSHWLKNKVDSIFEDETWDASRDQEAKSGESEAELPESVAWLNSLLASVWPLINPSMFDSLKDMLEDVMQASLPKLVRMVSVDDMGQGSEAFRILGIRWLPTAAAGQSVDLQGKLTPANDKKKSAKDNDRSGSGEAQMDEAGAADNSQGASDDKQKEQEQQATQEGLEAEEGDFVNMELAFAYRARSHGKSIRARAKQAHLYLKFYLPGGIAVPVWVELKGIIGIMRIRLQLTPDPPFFDLCTLTFLGQPRANLSCVPLSKHGLNLMDVPLISSFVQSAVDAALAEYVAPKSLTLNLKDMLVGDDFKKDTAARGVVMVHIKHATGFKEGDGGVGPTKGSSDSYVAVSWGKFGKPMASTRVIVDEQRPAWNEWAWILVTAEEVNAQETLRLQLWDSDKWTADDDLGRVEVSLKELMHGEQTKNRMHDREDRFTAEDPDEEMPGSLTWSVGYFEKAGIQSCQFEKQKIDSNVHDTDSLKRQVSEGAAEKLREAGNAKDRSSEMHQQTVQDYREKEIEMIISTPPPDGLRSGIVGIQIHNITGLETENLNKRKASKGGDYREDEAEQSDEMPDSYCTIILNHQKVYRTRTKPKNAQPFFNAGTERFVRDWKTAELIVSVKDSREGEQDPLLGIVYLPLRKVFEKRSQVVDSYPLAGGIGYGRARISLVWRSVELRLPKEISGWDFGTLEIKYPVKWKGSTAHGSLHDCRIKLHTKLGRVKMKPENGEWRPKHETDTGSVFLGVTKRYASPLILEFRKSVLGPDHSPGFAVFWLSDIPDEEEKTVTLKVWKGGKDNLRRARSCYDYEPDHGEQPLGETELTLKFWRGLSGYHKGYAHKTHNSDLQDIMEILDTIADEKMGVDENENEEDSDTSSSSDTDSDSEYGNHQNSSKEDVKKRKMLRKAGKDSSTNTDEEHNTKNPLRKLKNRTTSLVVGHNNGEENGSRGLRDQLQDYKKHHKSLHRKHRGIMQWKTARTLDWVANKADQGKGKVGDLFKHRDKEQGIETEV